MTGVDALLAEAKVLVVVGPGGVGKTTMAAALATRAAAIGQRRVLVVTVDPSKRLADVFGIDGETHVEPTLVPVGPGPGRLWAYLVDMSRSWDELVRATAPKPAIAEELLENRLYQTLTTRFAQSHDYIALDHLVSVASDPDRPIDLVVIDTPPSVHVLDILDAPGRMIQFFDSWLLKWLIAPYRSRLGQIAAKPFLVVADRVLGAAFVREMAEFFWVFSKLRGGFVRRAKTVEATLAAPTTSYVVVQTSDQSQHQRAGELVSELERRGTPPALIITNRAAPPELATVDVSQVDDEHLRLELVALGQQAAAEATGDDLLVAWRPEAVVSTVGLIDLLGPVDGKP